jgi:hypothetical protein
MVGVGSFYRFGNFSFQFGVAAGSRWMVSIGLGVCEILNSIGFAALGL